MIKFLLNFIFILAIVGFVALTALGVTPLSSYVGTGQKDLGIRVTKQQTTDAITKVGTQIISLPSDTPDTQGFRLEGTKPADFTMDSQEISAHSNNRPWKNYPVKNLQIKIKSDGTIESSAILIVNKAMPYALGLGYSQAQIESAMKQYNIPPVEVPIYVLGKGNVINNQVTVDAQQIKIGSVGIPNDLITQINVEAEKVLEDLIHKHSHSFSCESLTFDDGKLHFKGMIAEKQYVVSN